jgi:hypothetical protein
MQTKTNQRLLRAALVSNSAFSLASGLLLALAPASVASLLGGNHVGVLPVVGMGLVVFSLQVGFASQRVRVRPLEALLISLADFAWALGSLGLLAVMPGAFSPDGAWVFAGVATLVAAFGVAQLVGLRGYLKERTPGLGEFRYCLAVDVDANLEAMWSVLSDLGAIARYLPTLASSGLRKATTGSDQGSGNFGQVRECTSTRGQRWAEEVTGFDPRGHAFALRFLTQEPGFPFPMRIMHGGWQVAPVREGHCRVSVWWSLTPSVPFAGLAVVALMAASVDRDFPAVIARMAAAAMGEPLPVKPAAKLAAGYC